AHSGPRRFRPAIGNPGAAVRNVAVALPPRLPGFHRRDTQAIHTALAPGAFCDGDAAAPHVAVGDRCDRRVQQPRDLYARVQALERLDAVALSGDLAPHE